MKPLGIKAYGSIPHLPNSRLGPGDHTIPQGQSDYFTHVGTKDRRVIVEYKADGSNVAVAKVGGAIVPLVRAGYTADSSPWQQHHLFDAWAKSPGVVDRFESLLKEGERVVGEWLAQAHGSLYNLKGEPFIAFDLMFGSVRACRDEFWARTSGLVEASPVLGDGAPMTVEDALRLADVAHASIGGIDLAEGAVWRIERAGRVESLAKFVRHEKTDGKYMPADGREGFPIWHWWPGIQRVEAKPKVSDAEERL